ncbi:MAG: ferric reductase-like transmembrane domain-containing protein [Intrasporangium sp.]|uniref:ferric reductase-like transmembrane domain-containing protein n=1 Tax=Intrasporangium sp. TaxID=1925024 RepID=UPI003F80DA47
MNEALWYTSRATGTVSIVLLTAVVILGVVISGRGARSLESATVVTALHRRLSLGMTVFLLLHILTAVVETYVSIDAISAIVPFTSGYEPLWVGLGTLSFDILIAVVVTSLLRERISERVWRVVHWAAYALWPLALIHGFMLGTANEPLLRLATVACALAGVVALVWRSGASHHDADRRRDVASQEWS